MSAAAPTVDAGAGAPVKKGKKKLVITLVIVVLLVLAIAGIGAVLLLKKKAAEADGDDAASASAEHRSEKVDLKHPPTFLPLDPFVVNLADKDADRYAQVGITFEVADAHFAEEMKAFMPAIRNGILMILAHKSSAELLDREGKIRLAGEIQRESARTMGLEVDEPEPEASADDKNADAKDKTGDDDDVPKPKKKKKKRAASEPNPIRHVHFSNFIVQ